MFLNHSCFADVLYTGTADGKIVKIEGGNINIIATLGRPPCGKKPDVLDYFLTLCNVGFQHE